jgi:predicted hydrocarbon binding protein
MSADAYFYPQSMGHIILAGMEEVIGKSGRDAVLRRAGLEELIENPPPAAIQRVFPFEAVSQLQAALEKEYGLLGGQGFALRTGRACFKYGLNEYGSMLGVTDAAFRLLPLSAKLHTGAEMFALLFNGHTDQQVRVEEKQDQILWHIERCPLCWGRQTESPSCHLAVGVLQECLYWLSGGKVFNVEETACIANGGSACTIKIEKTPLS